MHDAEGAYTARQILQLSHGEASVLLVNYPDSASAQNGIVWQRDYVGLELGFYILNHCALLDLARKVFRENPDSLQAWMDIYMGKRLNKCSIYEQYYVICMLWVQFLLHFIVLRR